MRPTVSQYAAALEELAASPSADIALIVRNFFDVLRHRGNKVNAEAILRQLQATAAEKEGRVPITVVTAREADAEMKNLLTKKIEALFPGKRAELHFEIDASVIGGALFRTDEVLYDATLRAELKSLERLLIKA